MSLIRFLQLYHVKTKLTGNVCSGVLEVNFQISFGFALFTGVLLMKLCTFFGLLLGPLCVKFAILM